MQFCTLQLVAMELCHIIPTIQLLLHIQIFLRVPLLCIPLCFETIPQSSVYLTQVFFSTPNLVILGRLAPKTRTFEVENGDFFSQNGDFFSQKWTLI